MSRQGKPRGPKVADRYILGELWHGNECFGVGPGRDLHTGAPVVISAVPSPTDPSMPPVWVPAPPRLPPFLARGPLVGSLYGGEAHDPRDAIVEAIDGVPSTLGGVMTVRKACTLARSVAQVLQGWHDAGFSAGTLRPEVVFLRDGALAAVSPRIGSFLLSSRSTLSGYATPYTFSYAAAEVLRGYVPSPAADVFSLAACLAAWVTGKPPFRGPTSYAQMTAILAGERAEWDGPPSLTPALDEALLLDAGARPNLRQLLALLPA